MSFLCHQQAPASTSTSLKQDKPCLGGGVGGGAAAAAAADAVRVWVMGQEGGGGGGGAPVTAGRVGG